MEAIRSVAVAFFQKRLRHVHFAFVALSLTAVLIGTVVEAQVLGHSSSSIGKSAGFSASDKRSLIVTPEYYIGPEDILEVSVWRNAELSKLVTVRPDGRISLPLIGDIQASGLTPTELTGEITARLKDFVQTPTVAVMVKEVNSYSIYVVGQIAKPGRYFLKSKTTLLQAITLAGGFTANADRNKIVILRRKGANEEVKLNGSYQDIVVKDHGEQNIILKPGDTIIIPSETMVQAY